MTDGVHIVALVQAAPPFGLACHPLLDEELGIVVERRKHGALLGVIWRRELYAGDSGIPSIPDRDGIVQRCSDIDDLINDLGEDEAVHKRDVEVDQQVAEQAEDLFQILHIH